MLLKQQITNDVKTAMKAREMDKLTTLRGLMAEIKNVEIDKGDLSDDDITKIVARLVKQLKEANVDFEKGGREDLVEENKKQLSVLEIYLPQQLSDEELKKIIEEVIANNGSEGQVKIGPLTGMAMKKVAGKADGGRVSKMLRELL